MRSVVSAVYDVKPGEVWGETGKPGYGLYDRALGATYINGLFEALEKDKENK